jgi:hypothetical protein
MPVFYHDEYEFQQARGLRAFAQGVRFLWCAAGRGGPAYRIGFLDSGRARCVGRKVVDTIHPLVNVHFPRSSSNVSCGGFEFYVFDVLTVIKAEQHGELKVGQL